MSAGMAAGMVVPWLFILFFSGIERAFHAVNKLQVELQDKDGNFQARVLLYFIKRPEWLTGTLRTGSVLSAVSFALIGATVWVPVFQRFLPFGSLPAAAVVYVVIAGPAIAFTQQFLSTFFLLISPHRVLRWLALPFALTAAALSPLTYAAVNLYRFWVRRRTGKPAARRLWSAPASVPLVAAAVPEPSMAANTNEPVLHHALAFKHVRIRDCMIPRTEITAVEVNDSVEKLRQAFVESGFSRVIVYRGTIDDVIGYCSSAALLKNPARINDIVIPILTAPETTPANDLMVRFLHEQKNLAVVMDEFGGTAGIVSMEDIIEEIFGETADERDEALEELKIDDLTYLFSARLEVAYLNGKFGLGLPQGDYDTLGGLILSYADEFPKAGDIIVVAPFSFLVLTVEETRLGTVRLTMAPPAADA